MNKSFIVGLVALVIFVQGAVIPFDNEAVKQIFQDKAPGFILLSSSDDASTAAKEALKALDEEAP